MAIQTKPWTRILSNDEVVLETFMEYDDADYQTINDDGDPDDFRVIRWFGTWHGTGGLRVQVKRPGGNQWVDQTIPAAADPEVGTPFSQSAGGQVKYESDVPQWSFGEPA